LVALGPSSTCAGRHLIMNDYLLIMSDSTASLTWLHALSGLLSQQRNRLPSNKVDDFKERPLHFVPVVLSNMVRLALIHRWNLRCDPD